MASSSTKHFIRQRTTAMIQVPLSIWLIVSILSHAGDTRTEMLTFVSTWYNAALFVLFFLSVPLHMSLGIGEVIDDYLHGKGLKSLSHMLNSVYALVIGTVGIVSVIAVTLIA